MALEDRPASSRAFLAAMCSNLVRGWDRHRPRGTAWLGVLLNSAIGLAAILLVVAVVKAAFAFFVADAIAASNDVAACRNATGACWPFIQAKSTQFLFGRYPADQLWRAATAALAPPLLTASVFALQRRTSTAWLGGAFASGLMLSFALLAGGVFGLPEVRTELWGGLTLTLMVAYTGFAASLPLGLALALGRTLTWPVPRILSIGFIELWRGVPLVTVLFLASVMLPLFLPEGVTVDKLARALIVIALFASAYMAEVIRGGLLSIPSTQFEAAEALGFTYAQTLSLAILPQALRNALPGIVGTFIGLLKDTTLVLIIGLFDFLGMIQLAASDPAWSAPSTAITGYAFAALVYWCLCFGLSRIGAAIESETGRGR